jgi:hypothetical protein
MACALPRRKTHFGLRWQLLLAATGPGTGTAGARGSPAAAARAEHLAPARLRQRRFPGRPLREHTALSRAAALVAGGGKLDDALKARVTAPRARRKSPCAAPPAPRP